MDPKLFAELFKTELNRNNWKQSDFVKYSGLSKGRVNDYATRKGLPKRETLSRICDTFMCSQYTREMFYEAAGYTKEKTVKGESSDNTAKETLFRTISDLSEDQIELLNEVIPKIVEYKKKK